jgi:long-chain fatty acid transport protein
MRRRLAILVVLAFPVAAHAGGFEILTQSAQAVGTAGAQGANARDPSAVFYNPAGMAFQNGFGALVNLNVIPIEEHVKGPTTSINTGPTALQPSFFATQRLGPHFAVGIGLFGNFAQDLEYPHNWEGRFVGTELQLRFITINPAVAIRPVSWLSLGFGLDIVPSSIEIERAENFGSGEGSIHVGATATGVGGNLGLLAQLYKKYLEFGFTYRSSQEFNFGGKTSIVVPVELFGQQSSLQDGKTSLTMPHNFNFALHSAPTPHLDLMFDAHLTLWHVLDKLTLTLTDPANKAAPPTTVPLDLQWKDSAVLLAGGEYRVLNDRLALRLGVGYDFTPVPVQTMGPLAPDNDRVLATGGIGYRYKGVGLDFGYMAVIVLKRTSQNPDFRATYDTLAHVIAISLSVRASQVGGRLNVPAYKD